MREVTGRFFSQAARICLILALIAGCATTASDKPAQPEVRKVPLFPPQSVMESGDYAGFLAENESALKSCADPDGCAVALFNLSFLYSYSKSPYYNPARGKLYLEDLIKGAPSSPWAYQAQLLLDILKKKATRETARKRPAKEEARQKEAAPAEPPEQNHKPPEAQEELQESDRRLMEEEIRARDETIKELNRQLERSRQIDIEIEKKQRGLPY